MAEGSHFVERAAVLASALIYWGGVFIQARRVRRHIGKAPNTRPRGAKERLLWAGWFVVIVAWMALPFLARHDAAWLGLRLVSPLPASLALGLGLWLLAAGYAGTLWCYAAMGDAWRIGVNRAERSNLVTRGPYARVRHPIYLFQMVMLAGVVVLLPTAVAALVFLFHLACVLVKALDEEAYLLGTLGPAYRDYLARTGRLLPRLRKPARGAD
jgi:protein-S-isoprenylcysteine O-methyltransferase Ste14